MWFYTFSAMLLSICIGSCKKDKYVEKVGKCPLVISTVPANLATSVPLNQVITATFNEEMNPNTITSASFVVSGSVVPGKVTFSGVTATFIPDSQLMNNHTYTGRIKTTVKDLAGNALQYEYVWTFSTGTVLSPVVITTDPAAGDTGVVLNKVVTATFNMVMDPATIITPATSFSLKETLSSAAIAGTVSYTGSTASFTPTLPFKPNTSYTGTITTAVKSAGGLVMPVNYVWSFRTGSFPAPLVISTDPLNNAVGVSLNKVITATFNMAMDPATLVSPALTYSVKETSTSAAVAGTISYTGTTASFVPTALLKASTNYTATISTAAKNIGGTAMLVNYVWNFTTGLTTVPTVISTSPLSNATGVALNKIITATFSEPMDPATLVSPQTTFSVKQKVSSAAVAGSVTYSGSTATFTPSSNLLSATVYTATISTLAKNPGGVGLASDYVWDFTTVGASGPLAPDLKSVGRFGIISGVGVSNNAGASEIHDMDVGIYPGVRSSITGFFLVDGGPGLIFNGNFYAQDDGAAVAAMLLQAKNDLTAAYLYAEGATSPAPASVSGDQGGKTLAPGIYKSTSTLLIQNGDLTLDAQGDANAVWIFQIAAAFTTVGSGTYPSPSGGNVILSGGAQAKNVYWQVGSSATIGDYTSFKGNIMALTSVTMNGYSRAEGRMLCSNGSAVLTSTNIITKP